MDGHLFWTERGIYSGRLPLECLQSDRLPWQDTSTTFAKVNADMVCMEIEQFATNPLKR